MPRPNVSAERTIQILEAATSVFAEKGFQATRMEDIAARTGVSKGTLYLYFSSKDAIIAGLLDHLFGRQLEDARRVLAEPGTIADRLTALTQRIAVDIERMSHVMPIAWEFYAIAARQESVRAFFRDYFRAERELLSGFLAERLAPEQRGQIDVDVLCNTLLALYEGTTLLWITDPDSVDWNKQALAAVQLVVGQIEPGAPNSVPHAERKRRRA